MSFADCPNSTIENFEVSKRSPVRILQGLKVVKSEINKAPRISKDNLETYLSENKNSYEVLNDDINRIYFDIEGEETGAEFDDKIQKVIQEMQSIKNYGRVVILTAHQKPKISFHVIFPEAKMTRESNKLLAKSLQPKMPENIKVDLSVYRASNNRMRMLYTSKEGQNRPFVLLNKNDKASDTAISYIDEATLHVFHTPSVEKPEKPKVEKPPKKTIEQRRSEKEIEERDKKFFEYADLITRERRSDYQSWLLIGSAFYNAGLSVEQWDSWSREASNWSIDGCSKKWEECKKLNIGMRTILDYIKEDTPETYYLNTYEGWKEKFEETHFILKSPVGIIKINSNDYQQLSKQDAFLLYAPQAEYLTRWIADTERRTYDELVFLPKKETPANKYNIAKPFEIEPQEGEFDAFSTLLKIVCNNEEHVMIYLEKWLASIFQKPYEKTRVCVILQGEQGVGKDTFVDAIGKILGKQCFFSTSTPENNIFNPNGFNSGTETCVLVKFEEAEFQTNKHNDSKLKSIITSPTEIYTKKGKDPITLNDFRNIIMTTNKEIPVKREETDRRFVFIRASSEKRGDHTFWNELHKKLETQMSAYHHHLLNIDLNGFDAVEQRVETSYTKEIKEAFIPPLATFLQKIICDKIEKTPDYVNEVELQIVFQARQLTDKMKEYFPKLDFINTQYTGKHMREFIKDGCVSKHEGRAFSTYRIYPFLTKKYLEAKAWWIEDGV